VSYDDLLKDKSLMRAMKEALLGCSEQDLNEEEQQKSEWNGKTIFELLRRQSVENVDTETDVERDSTSRRVFDDVIVDDVIVGRCLVEHSDLSSTLLQVGSKDESAKNASGEISSILQDGSTSSLRAIERGDSGEEDQMLNTFVAEGVRDKTEKEDDTKPESQIKPSQTGDSPTGISSAQAESGLGSKLVSNGGETRLGTSLSFALSLVHHPAILAACYCLACLHQLTGLDFVTSLGILMAMISMVAMFFF